MINELIKREFQRLLGKNIKVFFKYVTISYNIKKSGKLLDCDERFFVMQEVEDGRQVYSYNFVVSLEELK